MQGRSLLVQMSRVRGPLRALHRSKTQEPSLCTNFSIFRAGLALLVVLIQGHLQSGKAGPLGFNVEDQG